MRRFPLAFGFILLSSVPVLAIPVCETGVSAKLGDKFISARFCKDGESIVIHYTENSECQIEFAKGTLFNKADVADAKGHVNGQWSHSQPGVYLCN